MFFLMCIVFIELFVLSLFFKLFFFYKLIFYVMFNRYIWKYFLVGLESNYDSFYVMKLLKIFLIFIVIYDIE